MSNESHFDTGVVSFIAGSAITKNQLVKISADDTVVPCTANTDQAIGVATDEADRATGDIVSVKLLNANGTISVIASTAITFGTLLFPATAGKVGTASASGSRPVGRAKNGASGDTVRLEMISSAIGNLIA